MANVKRLARGWLLEVESATAGTWLEVGGVSSFSESWDVTAAEGSTFDAAGWGDSSPAERSLSIEVEGFFLEDSATGARDAGQERVELLGRQIDIDGNGNFRVTSPATAGAEVVSGTCWFELAGRGGTTNEYTSWGTTVHYKGAPTFA